LKSFTVLKKAIGLGKSRGYGIKRRKSLSYMLSEKRKGVKNGSK